MRIVRIDACGHVSIYLPLPFTIYYQLRSWPYVFRVDQCVIFIELFRSFTVLSPQGRWVCGLVVEQISATHDWLSPPPPPLQFRYLLEWSHPFAFYLLSSLHLSPVPHGVCPYLAFVVQGMSLFLKIDAQLFWLRSVKLILTRVQVKIESLYNSGAGGK